MLRFDYSCSCGKEKIDHRVKKYDVQVKCDCGRVMRKGVCAPNLGGMNKQGSSGDTKLPDNTSVDGIF